MKSTRAAQVLACCIGAMALAAGFSTKAEAADAAAVSPAPSAQPAHHRYMILPFGDATDLRFRAENPNASTVVRDAFEDAFIDRGYHTVSYLEDRNSNIILQARNTYDRDVKVESSSPNNTDTHTKGESRIVIGDEGISTADGMKFAKEAGADVVIFGTVTNYYRGRPGGRIYTTVGYSVKAVDVNTGEILWKKGRSQGVSFFFDIDPAIYAKQISKLIVDDIGVAP
jgi:hypothetical protein